MTNQNKKSLYLVLSAFSSMSNGKKAGQLKRCSVNFAKKAQALSFAGEKAVVLALRGNPGSKGDSYLALCSENKLRDLPDCSRMNILSRIISGK